MKAALPLLFKLPLLLSRQEKRSVIFDSGKSTPRGMLRCLLEEGLGRRVSGLAFRFKGLRFRDYDSGFWGQGLGFRVEGLGFRVLSWFQWEVV
jgi:hypothetical protein